MNRRKNLWTNGVSSKIVCQYEHDLHELERKLLEVEAARTEAQNQLDSAQRSQAVQMKDLLDPLNEALGNKKELLSTLDRLSNSLTEESRRIADVLH